MNYQLNSQWIAGGEDTEWWEYGLSALHACITLRNGLLSAQNIGTVDK